MRLIVTTPMAVAVEVDAVRYLRAEDESGAFGILPGHADLVSVLAISVVTWRNHAGGEHQIAVRGGVLTVRDGNVIEIATREAVSEDTLAELGTAVLERLRQEEQSEKEAWMAATRLQLATIRYLQRYLEAGSARLPRGALGGGPAGIGDELDEA